MAVRVLQDRWIRPYAARPRIAPNRCSRRSAVRGLLERPVPALVRLGTRGPRALELNRRMVHVATAIDPGKLANRFESRDVADEAQVEKAVRQLRVRADQHAAAVIATVGERDEQEAPIDLALAIRRFERQVQRAIAKSLQLTKRRERVTQAPALPAAPRAGHGGGDLGVEADASGGNEVAHLRG